MASSHIALIATSLLLLGLCMPAAAEPSEEPQASEGDDSSARPTFAGCSPISFTGSLDTDIVDINMSCLEVFPSLP